tara:strand:+ start:1155 stop:1577 length:423 start_codon:yes stop_codon:yes gene_type:complete
MAKGIQIVLKCLAVVLALGMLSGYVWKRQRAGTPSPVGNSSVNEATPFPITPASPTLFDTSKSGKLTVDPALFSTSKSGPVDLGITRAPGGNAAPPPPAIASGSKNLIMPLFSTEEIQNGQKKINDLIQKAEGNVERPGK